MIRSFSIIALIASNLIPLLGVLFFGWNDVLVLALFWIENLVIGVFNVLKMLSLAIINKKIAAVFTAAFFVFHYGMFWSGHGLILWDILELKPLVIEHYFTNVPEGIFKLFITAVATLLAFVDMFGAVILFSISALVLSHAVSFIENFLLAGEIFKSDAKSLMGKPYTQVMVMHAGLILGAIAIGKFGSTVWLLLIIVLFKLCVDIWQHRRRRQKHADTFILNEKIDG